MVQPRAFSVRPELLPTLAQQLRDHEATRQGPVGPSYWVDEQTWSDLELDRIHERLDRCVTPSGSQQLYAMLRHPLLDSARLGRRYAQFRELGDHPEAITHVRRTLSALGVDRGWLTPQLLYGEVPTPSIPRWVLVALPLLMFLLASVAVLVWPPAWLTVVAVGVAAVIVHLRMEAEVGTQMSSLVTLSQMLGVAQRLCNAPLPGFEDDRDRLPRLLRGRHLRRVRGAVLLHFDDPTGLSEIMGMVTLRRERAYAKGLQSIREEQDALRYVFEFVTTLDVAVCAEQTLREHGDAPRCRPTLADTVAGPLEMDAASHPCVASAVTNPVRLGPKGLVVTGLNMSGKSTYLRTVGVNAVLAATLGVVWAEAYRGPPLRVMTSMGVADDLSEGTSYYMAEVRSLAAIFEAGERRPLLLILDELLRGTNSVERVAAVTAILDHLGERHLVVAATHDMEITRRVASRLDSAHFADDTELDAPLAFDHRLRPGPCPTRNGLKILHHARFPASVLKRAAAVINELEGDVRLEGHPQPRRA